MLFIDTRTWAKALGLLAFSLLGACSSWPGSESNSARTAAASVSAVTKIVGAVERPVDIGCGELNRQPNITQSVSFDSGRGRQSHAYVGVPVWTLLGQAGPRADSTHGDDLLDRYVLATAADGYKVVFSLGEINPDFGNRASLVTCLETLDGKPSPLDARSGPMRLTSPGDIKGGRYVSGLTTLDLRKPDASPGAAPPVLSLIAAQASGDPGALDPIRLQSLPAQVQTLRASVYTGAGLWSVLVASGLDLSIKNASLSMYLVATGSDGYRAVIALAEIDPGFGNQAAVIAYRVDGNPLTRNGPVRLVMPGDSKPGRSVSRLARIDVFVAR